MTEAATSPPSTVTPSSDDPYYLSINENPSLILVSQPLNGSNYHSWSQSMKLALLSKNKYQFVDGTIKAPAESDPKFISWQRCNTTVLSWIIHSISPSIAQSILWISKAYDAWEDLHLRFSQGDSFRISDLQKQIYSYQQGEQSISDYFTKLKTLMDKYLQFRPIPTCTCTPACSCEALKKVRTYYESDFAIHFLQGLNSNYSTVRTQIMIIDPLPSINKIFSMVMQQERQLQPTAPSSTVESNVFLARNNINQNISQFKKFYSNNNRPKCSHCGLLGHTVDKCFKLHGYPPGFKKNYGRGNQPTTNLVQSPSVSNNPPIGSCAFTPDQYYQLLKLLDQNTVNSTEEIHAAHFAEVQSRGSGHSQVEDDWSS